AAPLVGTDAEPGAPVLAEPHREAPHRARHVLRGDRRAAAGHMHMPVVDLVARDAGLHRVGLQKQVERLHRRDVAPGRPVLEHLAEPLGPLPQRRDVPLAALRRLPAVRAEERPDVVQRLYLGVYEVDRRLGVLVEVHGSKVVGARYRSESSRMVNTVASRLNPMLRSVILAAARSPRVERLVATAPVSRDVVRRFVAGTATADALRATRELADTGLGVSLDYLGEDTLTPDQAEQTRDEYV